MPVIPIVLCVDAEPDLRQPHPAQPVGWAGWDAAQPMLSEWRTYFAAATGRAARFGWYLRMDPQIETLHGDAGYLAARDRPFLDRCAAAGDEIGVHSHAHRWDAAAKQWIVDHADAAWIDRVIDLGCAAYRRAFRRGLRSFRFGDGFLSNAAIARLARAGVRYDLSLEPGLGELTGYYASEVSTGTLPDRRALPRVPYRPARDDFRRASRWPWHRLWMVPMSTAPPPPGHWPGNDYIQMNFAHPPAPTAAMFDWLLAERPAPFAVIGLRAGDMAQPELAANIQANLNMLHRHPRVGDFAFMTPAAVVRWCRRSR